MNVYIIALNMIKFLTIIVQNIATNYAIMKRDTLMNLAWI